MRWTTPMPSLRALATAVWFDSETMRMVLASESTDDVDAVLRAIVDVVVEAKGGGGGAAGSVQDEHAREIEPLRDQPALGLALYGLAFRERPLGDEEDLPPVAQHQLVNPAHRALLERPQRRPEIGRGFNRLPDRVFAAPAVAAGLGVGLRLPRAGLALFFLLRIARRLAALAARTLAGPAEGPNRRAS